MKSSKEGIINLGLFGYGVVGTGVGRLFHTNKGIIEQRANAKIRLKSVVIKNLNKKREYLDPSTLITNDPSAVLDDPDVDIVVEMIGGIEPAKSYILRAIDAGKSVVTANKELMANHGKAILEEADAKGVDVFFEASVGGGIPIIRALKESMTANNIRRIFGIVNGTTNYILTKMKNERISLEASLAEAQRLGYAELDPSMDVDGLDASAKLAILASIAFNVRVVHKNVYAEGIRGISELDIEYARDLGYTIKLLAIGEKSDSGIAVRVHPTLIPSEHVLASVSDAYNAILVIGDASEDIMFYGKGAGSLPTASAVVADIIDVVRNLMIGRSGKIGCTCFNIERIIPIEEVASKFYIVLDVVDRAGVLARIAGVFGKNDVSIESVIQKQRSDRTDLVFVTHSTQHKNLYASLKGLKKLDIVKKTMNFIRVEELRK